MRIQVGLPDHWGSAVLLRDRIVSRRGSKICSGRDACAASLPGGEPARSYDHTGCTLAWWFTKGAGACDVEHEDRFDVACGELFGFESPTRMAEAWTATEVVAKLLDRPALMVWRDMTAALAGTRGGLHEFTRELGLELLLHREGSWSMAFGRPADR